MIKDYNGKGVARQGDVILFRLPESIKVNQKNEISPVNGRIILLEGEMTGHHHAIDMDRPAGFEPIPVKTSKAVEDMLSKAFGVTKATARFYNDTETVQVLVNKQILTRTDLAIGILSVEGGGDVGVVLKHEEHDGIRLLAGNYYVGRQVESVGAEQRMVRD
jgi:hypothetical protein